MNRGGRVIVLLSGGIDSAALLHFYLKQGIEVSALHIRYGQPSGRSELQSARSLATYYDVPFQISELGFSLNRRNYEYLCRNLLFISTAASQLPSGYNRIAIGIHDGVPYYDSTLLFLQHCQAVLDGYFGGSVIVEAPFGAMSKQQIYEYCTSSGVPINMTYSCEQQDENPCGTCPSCQDREVFLI